MSVGLIFRTKPPLSYPISGYFFSLNSSYSARSVFSGVPYGGRLSISSMTHSSPSPLKRTAASSAINLEANSVVFGGRPHRSMPRAYVPALPPRSSACPSTPSAFLLACHTRAVSFRAKSLPALDAKNIWVVTAEDFLSVAGSGHTCGCDVAVVAEELIHHFL
jgi:hypothetical protein